MKQLSIKKANHYRSKYGFQHGDLAHKEQRAIKAPKTSSVKPFKRENQQSNLYKKREKRNNYKPHQQTTNTEHKIPDLGHMKHVSIGKLS